MAEQTKLRVLIETPGIGQLSKLRGSLTQVDAAAKGLGNNFAKARIELKRVEQTTKSSVNSTRALRDSFRELANSVEFGSKRFKVATREAERLDKQLAKMEKRGRGGRMAGVAKGAGAIAGAGVFGGPEGALGAGIGLAFGGLPGAIAGGAIGAQLGGIRQAAGETASYAAELNKLRIALKGVTTSQDEYQQALAFVTQSSRQFAIPQEIVLRQFTKLQASVQGAGGSLEETKETFTGITAAVRATGGNLQDLDSALTATSQVFSKGKVSAEELRQQIGERLPGAFTLFADSMGKTPQELDKALEKGEVSLQDFLKFSQDIFERYGEAAETIVKSPSAAGARLAVELAELRETVGGTLQPIGALFQDLAAKAVGFLNSIIRKIQELGRNLGNLAAPLAGAIGSIAGGPFGPLLGALGRVGIGQLQALGEAGVEPDITQPTAGGGLPGITPGGGGAGAGGAGRGRQPMSMQVAQALIAARREQNDKTRIALELEARLLQIKEQQLDPARELNEIDKASVKAKEAMQKIDEDRIKQYDDMIKQFTLEGAKMFDIGAEGAGPKTPFDMLRESADAFTDSLGGTLEATKQLAEVGFQGLSDALTTLVVDGSMNFRQFASNLLADMARIIMQQIVVKSLMQAIGFGTGLNLSSFFAGNTPSFDMNAATGGVGGFGMPRLMAKGGITVGPSIAGEAGPEAVVPLPDGRSIPVKMQGDGTKVIVNVDAKGTSVEGDGERSKQFGVAIAAAVQSELIKQQRPGGLLA